MFRAAFSALIVVGTLAFVYPLALAGSLVLALVVWLVVAFLPERSEQGDLIE